MNEPPPLEENKPGQRAVRPLNDVVYTRPAFAKRIIDYFSPQFQEGDTFLDPCAGLGAFYDNLPEPKEYCEILLEEKDFLDWKKNATWCFANFPWSAKPYRSLSRHAFERCENVVSLIRLHNCLGTSARLNDPKEFSQGLKEVVLCDWREAGFPPEGFSLAVFHFRRGWDGGTSWTDWR
jgi:hypothetical protein